MASAPVARRFGLEPHLDCNDSRPFLLGICALHLPSAKDAGRRGDANLDLNSRAGLRGPFDPTRGPVERANTDRTRVRLGGQQPKRMRHHRRLQASEAPLGAFDDVHGYDVVPGAMTEDTPYNFAPGK